MRHIRLSLIIFKDLVKVKNGGNLMGRILILWLLGVPLSVLIILKLLGII